MRGSRAAGLALVSTLVSLLASAPPRLAARAEEAVLGTRAGFDLSGSPAETITVEAGTRLRERPDLRAPEIQFIDEPLELPIVERQPPWVRVAYGDLRGWMLSRSQELRTAKPAAGESRAWSSANAWVDREALTRANAFLGAGARLETLGPYRLLTDVEPGKLLNSLAAIARSLPASYAERYGLSSPEPGEETVLLFARAESYRAFTDAEPGLAQLEPSGHAGNGIAALAVAERDEAEALLVHELVHLLNRRALGLAVDLAPWLDEGLAEDLAYSQVDSSGRLRLGSLAGRTRSTNSVGGSLGKLAGDSFQITTLGPRALLLDLIARWSEPDRPPVLEILDLGWSEFADPESRSLLYPASGFLVRYLLDGSGFDGPGPQGSGRRSAPAFRTFLQAVAAGGASDGRTLLAALGTSEKELEAGFSAWLRAQAGIVEPPRRHQ